MVLVIQGTLREGHPPIFLDLGKIFSHLSVWQGRKRPSCSSLSVLFHQPLPAPDRHLSLLWVKVYSQAGPCENGVGRCPWGSTRPRQEPATPHPHSQTSLQVGSELTQMRAKCEKVWDVLKARDSELDAQQLALEGAQNQVLSTAPTAGLCQARVAREGPSLPCPIPDHSMATGFPSPESSPSQALTTTTPLSFDPAPGYLGVKGS